jgi:hypothetical protein
MATAAALTAAEVIDWTQVDTDRSRVVRGWDAAGRWALGSAAVRGDLLVVMLDGAEHVVPFDRAG